ncbi:MAG: hypothetical protein Alpg2KO_01220 [Alphaproteobacteria bacterium]
MSIIDPKLDFAADLRAARHRALRPEQALDWVVIQPPRGNRLLALVRAEAARCDRVAGLIQPVRDRVQGWAYSLRLHACGGPRCRANPSALRRTVDAAQDQMIAWASGHYAQPLQRTLNNDNIVLPLLPTLGQPINRLPATAGEGA